VLDEFIALGESFWWLCRHVPILLCNLSSFKILVVINTLLHRFKTIFTVEVNLRIAGVYVQGIESSVALLNYVGILTLLEKRSCVCFLTFGVGCLIVEAWADILVAHILVNK
jgi:hypothetical protein